VKDLSQYPVSFGYGAKDGALYGPNGSVGLYHRGEDRAAPCGTPVIVNGTTIGLVGSTGASTGCHCHLGKFVSGKDVNPQGKGFELSTPKVYSAGYDSTAGNYVKLLDNGGTVWLYAHLSKITVVKGQPLGGSMDEVEKLEHRIDELIVERERLEHLVDRLKAREEELEHQIDALQGQTPGVTLQVIPPGKYEVK